MVNGLAAKVLSVSFGIVMVCAAACGVYAVAACAPGNTDQAQAATFKKSKASGGVALTYTGSSSKVTVPAKYKGKKVVGFSAVSKGLKTVNVKKAKYLKTLVLTDNKIKTLSVSKNTRLVELDASDNKLSKLSVTKNKKLKVLRCSANKLSKLSVTKNKKLVELDCCENALAKLSVSKLAKLKVLCVAGNKLSKLDVRKNKKLVELDVSDNAKLAKLYVSNSVPKTTLRLGGCSKLDAGSVKRLDAWYAAGSRETDYEPALAG